MTTVAPQDSWGALSIPTQPTYAPFTPVAQSLWVAPASIPYADPTLAVILDFLATAINSDALAQNAWSQIAGAAGEFPIKRIFPHDPSEVVFSVSHLPALYMWRQSGELAYAADDWYRETVKVTGLWVYPLAQQANQRARAPFVNAMVKCLAQVIERGRTPSWRQPSDTTDARSALEGSVFYPYAGFESFQLTSWKTSKLLVPAADKTLTDAYPAVEMTFTMQENLVYGLDRFAPNPGGAAPSITLYDGSAVPGWTQFTSYSVGALVMPNPGNGYVYQCTTAGVSGLNPPVFPTTIGAAVSDGMTAVWTCLSTLYPNGNVTDSGPL